IAHLKRILVINPEIIAHDLHPDYLSTRYAMDLPAGHKIQVQHHHAHIVSCMAEHKLEGTVLGLSFDGTGYGTDGTVWGGEILIVREHDFERAGHLAYVPMPGSAATIKEPWRMAVSYLQGAYGNDFRNLNLPAMAAIENEKLTIISEMISKGINAPLTSSLGRLFDGVAAICGIHQRVNFEGQAAMALEMAASGDSDSVYEYEWDADGAYRILTEPIIRGVVDDVAGGIPVGEISSRFHRTLICLFTDLCVLIGKKRELDRVVLSGGVFQNSILLTGLTRALEERNFQVFSHQQVPTNDGGIALGQAVVAAATIKR
ncbi:MAG: carbamoyltransferase HypF, partial [Deltaproteobacteria bacterium]|nr:carbamoyltransferase HypF [Deltaproteobacteria bacterium]